MKLIKPLLCAAAIATLLLGSGCQSIAPDYSLEAYKNATGLKAESLALMAKSGEPYAGHAKDVDTLKTKVEAAYEFSKGTPRDSRSAEEWRILKDPDGNLLGGYLVTWSRAPQPEAFRTDKALQVGKAFDKIICLEANKQKAAACSAPVAEPVK